MATPARLRTLVTLTVLGGSGGSSPRARRRRHRRRPPAELMRATEVTDAAGERAPEAPPSTAELVGPDDPDIQAALAAWKAGGQAPIIRKERVRPVPLRADRGRRRVPAAPGLRHRARDRRGDPERLARRHGPLAREPGVQRRPRDPHAARPGQADRLRHRHQRRHHDHPPDLLPRPGLEGKTEATPHVRRVKFYYPQDLVQQANATFRAKAAQQKQEQERTVARVSRVALDALLRLRGRRRRRALEARARVRRRHARLHPDAGGHAGHGGAGALRAHARRRRRPRELPAAPAVLRGGQALRLGRPDPGRRRPPGARHDPPDGAPALRSSTCRSANPLRLTPASVPVVRLNRRAALRRRRRARRRGRHRADRAARAGLADRGNASSRVDTRPAAERWFDKVPDREPGPRLAALDPLASDRAEPRAAPCGRRPAPPAPKGPTPEELEAQRRERAERAAMGAPIGDAAFERGTADRLGARRPGGEPGAPASPGSIGPAASRSGVGDAGRPVGLGPAAAADGARSKAGLPPEYLRASVRAPVSPYEIKAGTIIPAVLLSAVNSDLPGQILAPGPGSRLRHRHRRAPPDPAGHPARRPVRPPHRLRPGARAHHLEAADPPQRIEPEPEGRDAGHRRHRGGRLPGPGQQPLPPDLRPRAPAVGHQRRGSAQPDPQLRAGLPGADGGERPRGRGRSATGETAAELIRRGMTIAPTLEIRPGYPFNVMVTQDVVFPGPYDDTRAMP